ncbi:MAG: hypothetical protein D6701_12740 [Gemmatimonadetes bacterium]|nr:MAG: hypothetical protein D6701_12740 [Gemmatimonadota bacterium]
MPAGIWWAAWSFAERETDSFSSALEVSWSDDGGRTWGEAYKVAAEVGPPNAVTDRCGAVHVGFKDGGFAEATPAAVVMRWTGSGEAVRDTLPGEPYAFHPVLAIDDEYLYAFYTVFDPARRHDLRQDSNRLVRRRIERVR